MHYFVCVVHAHRTKNPQWSHRLSSLKWRIPERGLTCVCASGYGEGLQTGLLVIAASHPQHSVFCIVQRQLWRQKCWVACLSLCFPSHYKTWVLHRLHLQQTYEVRDYYKRWKSKHSRLMPTSSGCMKWGSLIFFSNFLELVGILHFPGAPSIDFHGSCECSAVLQ